MDIEYGDNVFSAEEWAEQVPYAYEGDDLNTLDHRWDFGDGDWIRNLEMEAHHFTPGTVILVLTPMCPDCGTDAPSGPDVGTKCDCGFDWNQWALDQYA